jgi:hypothetical protein
MKSRFMKVAVLAAFVITSPLLVFAAGQPKVRPFGRNEDRQLDGVTRAVRQGKGSGMSRNRAAVPDQLQTAPNPGDTAFRK